MLNLLWQGGVRGVTRSKLPHGAIPSYASGEKEDGVDLQVKSLSYMYRRCAIAHIKSLGQGLTIDAPTTIESQKLDIMYNLQGFESVMSSDEHRVLIDWYKNKFRSLCILSGNPSGIDKLPTFSDGSFRFLVLPVTASDEEYTKVLSESDIYIEHSLSKDTRRRIVKNALEIVKGDVKSVLTKDDRAWIIRYYLNKVAVEVQVERLYRGTVKAKMEEMGSEITRMSPSPRSRSTSPERTMERNVATVKVRARKSQPLLEAVVNPTASPPKTLRKMKSASALKAASVTVRKSKGTIQSPPPVPALPSDLAIKERPSSPVRQYIDTPPSKIMVPKLSRSQHNLLSSTIMPGLPPSPAASPPKHPHLHESTTASPPRHESGTAALTDEMLKELKVQARIAVRNRLDREKKGLRLLIK